MLRRELFGLVTSAIVAAPAISGAKRDTWFLIDEQWKHVIDIEDEIEDSSDDFPLWNGGTPEVGTDTEDVRSCLAALGFYLKSRIDSENSEKNLELAWKILAAPHFPRVAIEQQFRAEAAAHGQETFWAKVATLPGGDPNFEQLGRDLAWQAQNNRRSIERALAEWAKRGGADGTLRRMTAMYYLMLGQRHKDTIKWGVQANYRSCYSAQPDGSDRLFGFAEIALRTGCGTSCADLLNCHWNLVYDAQNGIDETAPGIPLWLGPTPQPGVLRSPLAAVGYYLQSRIVIDKPEDMANAAFAILVSGQIGGGAASTYSQCRADMSDEVFWRFVLGINSDTKPDFTAAATHLKAQKATHPSTVKKAGEFLRSTAVNPAWRQMTAFYCVLLARRTKSDREVSKLYRACFRTNAEQVMQTILEMTA